MKRYLSIVLDKNCNISKTLIEDENYYLDRYISCNFNDSTDVRKKFDLIISNFLKNNSSFIEQIEKKNNKKYNGQIVILGVLDDGTLKRIKVIYKKDLFVIKNEFLKDQEFMRSFINDYKKYFSGYIINKSKRYLSKTDYQYMIGEWYRNIKENKNYFEICRDLLKYREIYLSNKKIVQNVSNKNDNISDFVNTNILGNDQDDKYDPDIEYYPDLDELEKKKYSSVEDYRYEEENEYIDVCEKVKTKIKQIPGQISFFD